MLSRELREFAEAPAAYLGPVDGTVVHDTGRYVARVVGREYVNVCRLRFAADEAASVLAEVRALAPAAVGSWQTASAALANALAEAGAREPAAPLEPTFTALATREPPPPAAGVDVRPSTSFEDFLIGLEIELTAEQFTDEARARRRRDAAKSYRRRLARPGGAWLAYVDGEAVGFASAIAGPRGLFLDGAATRPEARGRGVYRALIRARWEDAAERGTPALVVQAQETSRPILESCGFERVCTMYELEHDPL